MHFIKSCHYNKLANSFFAIDCMELKKNEVFSKSEEKTIKKARNPGLYHSDFSV